MKDTFMNNGLRVISETGGSKQRPDVSILVDNMRINFECKTKNAFEGGACGFDLIHGVLINRNHFFRELLSTYIPWGGKVPSFKTGNKNFEQWLKEKPLFKDEYIDISPDSVSKYYKERDIHYILIEKTGYFHTGENVLNLRCKLFLPKTRMRIRCKQHSGSSLPTTVQASLIFKV